MEVFSLYFNVKFLIAKLRTYLSEIFKFLAFSTHISQVVNQRDRSEIVPKKEIKLSGDVAKRQSTLTTSHAASRVCSSPECIGA